MPGNSFLLLVAAAATLLLLPTRRAAVSADQCGDTLDFEDANQQNCFSVPPDSKGKISLSNFTAKKGKVSLKLESQANDTSVFRCKRPSLDPIQRYDLWRGGIKMWIYKKTAAKGKKMEVRLTDKTGRVRVGTIMVDMGFKGWRGIWVSYGECKEHLNSLKSSTKITTVDFVFNHEDTIYIDLLDFVPTLAFQTRDKIVPPFTKFGSKYDYRKFWQQSYHWSQQTPTDLPKTIDDVKASNISYIESRLKNWYCDERTTTHDIKGTLKTRWDRLRRSIDSGHKEYDRLEFKTVSNKTVIIGPPLFCLKCTRGTNGYSSTVPERKFSFVMRQVLQPLALELYLKSRNDEITRTVTEETPKLNSLDSKVVRRSLIRICGKHQPRQDEFFNHLKSQGTPFTEVTVRRSLEYVNQARLQRIFNVLDYLEDQGWADGSAIGSLYMEMLQSGAGFVHSIFLLKDILNKDAAHKNRLLNLINTAKWHNDFGEVYQTSFEYNGTTADYMITRMIFRLLIVLAMPTDTEDDKKTKQRDMEALKRWIENALTINKALGGVIKPDYTGFHHMTFYASAYAPHALHAAAQVQYLLEGTNFQLSDTAKYNLREALKTLKLTAVKYSTASSIGGRFPDFSKAVLAKTLPAFAYISISYPGTLPSTPGEISVNDVNKDATMFLRLYQSSDDKVLKYLGEGKIPKGKYYFNSLGSLQIMSTVHAKATSLNMSAESSPEGHWSKNFAALSIHRRKEWAVTVKGTNRFVWDFEGTPSENAHGIFASHGQMLVANSEEVLKAHDVNEGWDWTRIPGATTMSLTVKETRLQTTRNFSPQSSAGGVSFQGPDPLSSGVFGMDYHQPKYVFKDKNHPYPNITLYFKKSVFFYRNLLVCLGSNIRVDNGPGKNAQTTLFQDKLVRGSSTFFIKVDGVQKNISAPFPAITPSSTCGAKPYTILVDTKGNSYYIPSSSAPSLKVHIQNQISESQSGKPSSGDYATAWLEHSSVNGSYEYAIYVKTPSYNLTAGTAWSLQEDKKQLYEVLQQDDDAHVVKFGVAPDREAATSPFYGYVVFQSTSSLPLGPIKAVNKQCRIMVADVEKELYLSISYPDLDFNSSKALHSLKDVQAWELFHMESSENQVQVTLTVDVDMIFPAPPKVHGSPPEYVPDVRVESSLTSPPNKGNKIVFYNLKNGFSVEIKVKK